MSIVLHIMEIQLIFQKIRCLLSNVRACYARDLSHERRKVVGRTLKTYPLDDSSGKKKTRLTVYSRARKYLCEFSVSETRFSYSNLSPLLSCVFPLFSFRFPSSFHSFEQTHENAFKFTGIFCIEVGQLDHSLGFARYVYKQTFGLTSNEF